MSFESCFGGFEGSKSAPAAMGGKATFSSDFGEARLSTVTSTVLDLQVA
jgi:hypothetical protein